MAYGELTAQDQRQDGSRIPFLLLGGVVVLIAVANLFADTLVSTAAVGAVLVALAIALRPEYAVTLLLGSFLVTYPWWLQGRGVLTLNNIIGGWLAIVMLLRLYRSGDWSFLRNRELRLLAGTVLVLLFSRYIHRPDDFVMQLVTPLMPGDQDPAETIVNRFVFFVFLVFFIRKPEQVRLIFTLAVSLMVLSGFAAIFEVLSGGGFAGYRARSAFFISAAGNPNRLALTAIIGIVSLWYLIQWIRNPIVTLVLAATIGVQILAIFMTGSRSGVVALGVAAVVLGLEGGISTRKIILFALTCLVGTMLVIRTAPERSLERIGNLPGFESSSGSDLGTGSVERREYGAQLALEVARRNPLIGVGIGNWEVTRFLNDPTHAIARPHSAVLTALAEGGLVTLGLYVLLLIRALRHFVDCATVLREPEHRGYVQWMAKSLRGSFIVFLAMSLVGDLWLNILFYWFVGLAVALSGAVFEPLTEHEAEQHGDLVGAPA